MKNALGCVKMKWLAQEEISKETRPLTRAECWLDFEQAAEIRDRIKGLQESPTLFAVPAGRTRRDDG
jgi:protein-arginine kinase activator protein McsA